MPNSMSARERANPPPRRKSCVACIKAKRRCDFGLPACLRCHQRGLMCEYGEQRRSPKSAERVSQGCPEQPPETLIPPDIISSGVWETDVCNDAPLSAPFDGCINFSEVMTGIPDFSAETFVPIPPGGVLDTIQGSGVLVAPTTTALDVENLVARKLHFAMDLIKDGPRMMVMETQTPWCHAALYRDGMPSSMRDVHASCALHMAKSRANGPVIMQAIEARVNELLATPLSTIFIEILARTQALILYQIMRLFDGDITARAAAERTMPDLEESTLCLLARIRFDLALPDKEPHTYQQQQLPLHPITQPQTFWKDWIIHESARRTILFSVFFIQMYKILVLHDTSAHCNGRLSLGHSWTMSKYLWTARTPLEFARAWRDRNHFVVTDGQLGHFLSEAKADDVDSFGRMFISALLGVEEAEVWFEGRGGCLRPSG